MRIVYAAQQPPMTFRRSIFLVGPTPRTQGVDSWRPDAIRALEEAGYDGVVFVPEDRIGQWRHSYVDQVEWELDCLRMSDRILAWIPRDLDTLPGFTTNVEFGCWVDSGRLLYGRPSDTPKTRYLDHLYRRLIGEEPFSDLSLLAQKAASDLSEGHARTGVERYIPDTVWKTPSFQSWYRSQRAAGNMLTEAEVLWDFEVQGKVFAWVLKASVYVEDERRIKDNEWVFSRKDIASVVMYRRSELGIQVVLVREFRTPARTEDGYIYEVPGGSSEDGSSSGLVHALEEVEEETGLTIEPHRVREIGFRQLAGTLSAHKARLFAVELTQQEMVRLYTDQRAHGADGTSERTYIEVMPLSQILNTNLVDWTSVGMILRALRD